MSAVLVDRSGTTLIITLNRPERRNAVDYAMSEAIAAALDTLDADAALRVGIITGAGGSFCSGMDLKAFVAGSRPELEGRGFGGLTEAPPGQAADRRRRGLCARRRMRDGARLRPDRGR